MKKITLMLALFMGQQVLFAQGTITFENHLTVAQSFDNGSAGNGDFIFDDVAFTNYFDAQWGSWNGFSISNVVDNTTAGWGNQYAAYPGSGASGSESYGIFYPDGSIAMNNWGGITGFKITNTTYAAISMRDGDGFAKQFGSVNGPDGNPDGTNGEDYFRVWIIGEDSLGTTKDSLLFYLADYRFADPMEDYIVDSWEYIDLTGFLFLVDKVSFRFESSDMGQWGINTPQYFAIDDVAYYLIIGLEEQQNKRIECYPNPVKDKFTVNGIDSGDFQIFDNQGREIANGSLVEMEQFSFEDRAPGVYTVYISNSEGQFIGRLIH